MSDEAEITTTLLLKIQSYGDRDRVEPQLVQFLCEALYSTFGGPTPEDRRWSLYDAETGDEWVYDHFAHDGHHPEHSQILIRKPKENA